LKPAGESVYGFRAGPLYYIILTHVHVLDFEPRREIDFWFYVPTYGSIVVGLQLFLRRMPEQKE